MLSSSMNQSLYVKNGPDKRMNTYQDLTHTTGGAAVSAETIILPSRWKMREGLLFPFSKK